MAEPAPVPDVAADWEYAAGEGASAKPGADAAPTLSVAGFEGPLDFLLEMVRRQRIDLIQLSIASLVDQFVTAFMAARAHVSVERRGDWLVMATTLLLLKAQLLWPATPEAAAAAEADAARRLRALDALAWMRAAAAWLAARPQLGIDVFPRGHGERPPAPQAELYVGFLEATLVMLEGRDGQDIEAPPDHRPAVSDLWRTLDAIARMKRLLAEHGAAQPLAEFLPDIRADASHLGLRRRAAVASTLMAALELARDGTLIADQSQPFGPIRFAAAGVGGDAASAAAPVVGRARSGHA